MKARQTSVAKWVAWPLFVGLLLCSSSGFSEVAPKDETTTSWWLEISTAKNTYRVRPDGSGWTEVPHVDARRHLSPDGKHVVYTDVPEDNKPRWNSEIFVADSDGKNARRLTKGEAQNVYPSWTPDGKRIVFASDRTGKSQVYAMDPDGSKLEQLTHEPEGAEKPKLASDGRLAYLALRERQGKLLFQDLIVREGAESKPVVQHALLYSDYAWSPDGTGIEYGEVGALVFRSLSLDTGKKLDFAKQIDPQMGSHAAFNLAWRPDGQEFACSIMFLGGRWARGPKMIGDSEVFVSGSDGRVRWFTMPLKPEVTPSSIRWVRQHDNRLTAEGHPEWKKLTAFFGEPYDSPVMRNFVRGYSLKSAQKFDEGQFTSPDEAYTLMYRAGKISDVILRVAPFKVFGDPGWIAYSKTLPGHLTANDRRADVVKKLGQPIAGDPTTDRGRDSWVADGVKIWVCFEESGLIDELFLSPAK